MKPADVRVLGTGFAGLTAATILAGRGHAVHCYGNGVPGASLANFGQLHSGAVYATVLPDVAGACWQHRDRWLALLDTQRSPNMLALFNTSEGADRYVTSWAKLGIDTQEIPIGRLSELPSRSGQAIVAAFRLPDRSVNNAELHARLTTRAERQGVVFQTRREISASEVIGTASTWTVLAAGARTPELLDALGVTHPLARAVLPYGVLPADGRRWPLTYWLDTDLLALSPQRDEVLVALPGRGVAPVYEERDRLASSVRDHWPEIDHTKLALRWGKVAEPLGPQPDPSVLVVNLDDPRTGWGRVPRTILCLPGKWTTAWHAADLVADLLQTLM